MKYYKHQGYWSVMSCWSPRKGPKTPHEPHVWDSELCMYGPYKCEDYPETPEYVGRHRKDVSI